MKHRPVLKNLLLYLDGDLSESETKAMDDHLSACPSCAGKLHEISSLWNSSGRFEREPPPSDLWNDVLIQIRNSPKTSVTPPKTWLTPIVQPLPVLLLILSIAIGLYLGSPTGSGSGPSELDGLQWDELGLDRFDMLTPEFLGIPLADISGGTG